MNNQDPDGATKDRPRKGDKPEQSIKRILDGSDPANGKTGVTNPAHREVTEAFLLVRKQVNRVSPLTSKNDVQAIVLLSKFLDSERGGVSFADTTADDLMAWREWLMEDGGLQESTADAYCQRVKQFYKFVMNRADYRRGRHVQRAMPSPSQVEWMTGAGTSKRSLPSDSLLSPQDIQRMTEACASPRDRAIIMTFWDAGVRLKELMNLNVRNFTTDRRGGVLILNVEGKEQKTGMRRIRLAESTRFLVAHLNSHPLKDHPDAPLFLTNNKRDYVDGIRRIREQGADEEAFERLRLTRTGVRGIVQHIAALAGVTKHVYPHLFRHSRATFLASRNVSEAVMRARFGWSPTSKTPALYQHLSGQHEDAAFLTALGVEDVEEDERETTLLARMCPMGHENEPTARFCAECGLTLFMADAAADSSLVSEDMRRLFEQHPHVARAIVENLARAVNAQENGEAGA